MGINERVRVQDINESQVPRLIQKQFSQLKVLKQNVDLATKKAESAQESAKSAKSKSAGLFQKKEAIESLQDAAVDLADAQISQAEAQELSYEYQQKLGEITKYLFGMGVTNIAVNRSVVRELEMRLKGASEEEIDELARQEIIGVLKQLKAQEDIMKKLEQNEIGVQLVNITIQDAEPPTVEVLSAFKAVETAKQGKETAINNANKYRNEKLPEAISRVDKILKDAEAQKQQRINEANAEVARFNAMYAEYIKNPAVTRQRMYYEAIEKVLPGQKIIISGSDSVQQVLPLDSFVTGQEEKATEEVTGQ